MCKENTYERTFNMEGTKNGQVAKTKTKADIICNNKKKGMTNNE